MMESTEDKIRKTAGLVKKELEMAINKYTLKIEDYKSTLAKMFLSFKIFTEPAF